MKWFESYFPIILEIGLICGFQMEETASVSAKKNGQEFIFTYHNQKDWKFETITSFLNGMKGGKK